MVGVEALPDGAAVNPTTKHGQGEASALRKLMAAIAAEGAEHAVREQKAIRGHNQFYLLGLDQSIKVALALPSTISRRSTLAPPWRRTSGSTSWAQMRS